MVTKPSERLGTQARAPPPPGCRSSASAAAESARGAANLRARHTPPPCAASCLPTPCPAHAQRRLNITPVCPHGHKLDCRSHPGHRSPLVRPRERLGAQHVGEEAYLPTGPATTLHTETRHPAHRTTGREFQCSALVSLQVYSQAFSRKILPGNYQASIAASSPSSH